MSYSALIIIVTDILMQLIFISYRILHQVISEPMNPVISWSTLLCERRRKKIHRQEMWLVFENELRGWLKASHVE